ncbi:hypothetical protein F511_33511 [Dorcoceras hygrometricum]|uniref:Uncharacterized protein n=1 Tax=Dorcoceras hygrometricum TaxID=472368 RepID=A0A2Z7B2R7_9LAMI|nr:hypothetical protein F511_33511 [Dorcoceras hygrometricum]
MLRIARDSSRTQRGNQITTVKTEMTRNSIGRRGVRKYSLKRTGVHGLIQIGESSSGTSSSSDSKDENPNHSDSAGYHDSVTTLDSVHSADRSRLSDIQGSKERNNYWPKQLCKKTNTATTSHFLDKPNQSSTMVPIERSRGDELSTTDLAPNDGVNRRQSKDLCSDDHQWYSATDQFRSDHFTRYDSSTLTKSDYYKMTLRRSPAQDPLNQLVHLAAHTR